MSKIRQVPVAGALVVLTMLLPSRAAGQQSGVQIWAQTCGRCHLAQPANRYSADQWQAIMANMKIYARLTDTEATAVLEFLQSGAKQVAAAAEPSAPPGPLLAAAAPVPLPNPTPAEKLFEQYCAACHGKTGRGNGPAAASLNPRPPDLTAPEFLGGRSDVDLARVIAEGVRTMPPFRKRLTQEDIDAIVQFIREAGKSR